LLRARNPEEIVAGDTFVDFDLGLNSAVKKLRQALGDESDNPRSSKRCTGAGIVFLAPVQDEAGEPCRNLNHCSANRNQWKRTKAGGNGVAEIPGRGPLRQQASRKLLLSLPVPILLGVGLLGGYWLRPATLPRITGYQQITSDGRQKYSITSDGSGCISGSTIRAFWNCPGVGRGRRNSQTANALHQHHAGWCNADGSALLVANFIT